MEITTGNIIRQLVEIRIDLHPVTGVARCGVIGHRRGDARQSADLDTIIEVVLDHIGMDNRAFDPFDVDTVHPHPQVCGLGSVCTYIVAAHIMRDAFRRAGLAEDVYAMTAGRISSNDIILDLYRVVCARRYQPDRVHNIIQPAGTAGIYAYSIIAHQVAGSAVSLHSDAGHIGADHILVGSAGAANGDGGGIIDIHASTPGIASVLQAIQAAANVVALDQGACCASANMNAAVAVSRDDISIGRRPANNRVGSHVKVNPAVAIAPCISIGLDADLVFG